MLSFFTTLLAVGCNSSGASPTRAPTVASKDAAPPPVAGGAGPQKQWTSPPPMAIDPNKQYSATISTNVGEMKAQLYAKENATAKPWRQPTGDGARAAAPNGRGV